MDKGSEFFLSRFLPKKKKRLFVKYCRNQSLVVQYIICFFKYCSLLSKTIKEERKIVKCQFFVEDKNTHMYAWYSVLDMCIKTMEYCIKITQTGDCGESRK